MTNGTRIQEIKSSLDQYFQKVKKLSRTENLLRAAILGEDTQTQKYLGSGLVNIQQELRNIKREGSKLYKELQQLENERQQSEV